MTRCIRMSRSISTPSLYPSRLREINMTKTLTLHAAYSLNRPVRILLVVSPLSFSDSSRTLTFTLNFQMSCPHYIINSSRMFSWILIWMVVAFVSRWYSRITTLISKFTNLRVPIENSSNHTITWVFAYSDSKFMMHLYIMWKYCADCVRVLR